MKFKCKILFPSIFFCVIYFCFSEIGRNVDYLISMMNFMSTIHFLKQNDRYKKGWQIFNGKWSVIENSNLLTHRLVIYVMIKNEFNTSFV